MELITGDTSRLTRELRTGLDVTRRYRDGKTLLILAAEHGKPEHLQELLKHHAEVNAADDSGMTSLMYAADEPHVGNVSTLLTHGADVNLTNNRGQTALMLATQKSSKKCVGLLLAEGADVNVFDHHNNSALSIAVSINNTHLTDMFLRGNPNVNHLKIVYDIAKCKRFEDLEMQIKAVIQRLSREMHMQSATHLETQKEMCYAVSVHKHNTQSLELYGAASGPRLTTLESCSTIKDVNRFFTAADRGDAVLLEDLLNRGVDVNIQDQDGTTALILAAEQHHDTCIKLLFKYRANVNQTNVRGQTALMFAAFADSFVCVDVLLNNNANVNMSDVYGETPLTLAAAASGVECNELLLHAGADLNHRTAQGLTALEVATKNNNKDVVNLYEEFELRQKRQSLLYNNEANKIQHENAITCFTISIRKELSPTNAKTYPTEFSSIYELEKAMLCQLQTRKDINVSFFLDYVPLMFETLLGSKRSSDALSKKTSFLKGKLYFNETSISICFFEGQGYMRLSMVILNFRNKCIVPISVLISNGITNISEEVLISIMSSIRTDKSCIENANEEKIHISLATAITNNNNHEIEKAVRYLLDVNCQGESGITPLMFAAFQGSTFCIKLLLDLGARIDATDKRGTTALMYAVMNNKVESVKALIERGASFNITNTNMNTALSLAVYCGYRECANVLVNSPSFAKPRHVCEDWSSELILAVENNHKTCLSNILESGFNADVRNNKGMTPLICAVLTENEELFNVLISKGANVNFTAVEEKTPLMGAAWVGNVQLLEKLIELKADMNSQDCNGYTALMFACHKRHDKCVKILLDHRVDSDLKTNNGETALSVAVQNGHSACIKMLEKTIDETTPLLQQSTSYPDDLGCPILNAVWRGDEYNLSRYLKGNVSKEDKNKALLVASATGKLNILKLTLQNGAKVNVLDRHGVTPMMECAMGNHVDCLKELISRRANSSLRNINGVTALMLAAMYGHEECLSVLIKSGANLNIQDDDGVSAVMHATKNNQRNCLALLLTSRAYDFCQDKNGNTALMLAAEKGFTKCVKILLKQCPWKRRTNYKHLTAYDIAKLNNHDECCRLLKI